MRGIGHLLHVCPAARNLMQDDKETQDRARHIKKHLHHVGPDDGRHAAFKRVEQREANDGEDGNHFARSENGGNDYGDGEHPHTLSQRAQQQKCSGGKFSDALPKAPAHQLISGEHLAAKILRQKQHGDHDPPQQVSQDELQKLKISIERQHRRPDDGERTGFRRNNGERDGPPGRGVSTEKIIFQATLAFAKARPKPGDRKQIGGDSAPVEKTHEKADDSTAHPAQYLHPLLTRSEPRP